MNTSTVSSRTTVGAATPKPRRIFASLSRQDLIRTGLYALFAVCLAGGAIWFLLPATFEVVHPVRGDAVEAVYATGTVEPTVMTPIAPRIGARLVMLAVDEGATIRKGQVLAQLESDDVANAVKQLEAQEQFARQDYQRYAALARQGAIARQTFERAKSVWQAAHAAEAQSRAQAGFMTLIAPADGYVIRRDGELGQLIPANQPLFWLSCDSPLRISTDVDEEDIRRVRIGQEVVIRADGLPGKILRGRVTEITPKGDPVARSYRVRVSLPRGSPLMIGMTAETNIVVYRKANAVLLPPSALVGDSVWTLKNERLAKTRVDVGARGPTAVEIRRGIDVNIAVVRKPSTDMKEQTIAHAAPSSWAP